MTLRITTAPVDPQWLQGVFSGKYPAIQLTNDSTPIQLQYGSFLAAARGANSFKARPDPVLAKLVDRATVARNPATYWPQISRRIVQQADLLPVFASDRIWFTAKNITGVAVSTKATYPVATDWAVK